MKIRKFHYQAAVLLCLPLALSAVTGLTYRIGRNWFGMSSETGKIVRGIHEGAFLGEVGGPLYVLFVGLGLLALIGTGLALFTSKFAIPCTSAEPRWWHRGIAAVMALPLAVTAVTGIGFRISQAWLGWSKEQAKLLMDIHQGTYLGPSRRAYYVIVIGTGLLMLLITGLQLLNWGPSRRGLAAPQPPTENAGDA